MRLLIILLTSILTIQAWATDRDCQAVLKDHVQPQLSLKAFGKLLKQSQLRSLRYPLSHGAAESDKVELVGHEADGKLQVWVEKKFRHPLLLNRSYEALRLLKDLEQKDVLGKFKVVALKARPMDDILKVAYVPGESIASLITRHRLKPDPFLAQIIEGYFVALEKAKGRLQAYGLTTTVPANKDLDGIYVSLQKVDPVSSHWFYETEGAPLFSILAQNVFVSPEDGTLTIIDPF